MSGQSDRQCVIDGCDKTYRAKRRGYCNGHYQRWIKYGDPTASGTGRPDLGLEPEERFWGKVDKSGDCWLWTGNLYGDGYGTFWIGTKRVRAHRFAYEAAVGPIPEGLVIDHLCRVRHCVNPGHLEAVTNRENLIRGARARRAMHHFTPDELAALLDRVRREAKAEAGERIAQAIEGKYLGPDSGRAYDGSEAPDAHCRNAYDDGLYDAARIARSTP